MFSKSKMKNIKITRIEILESGILSVTPIENWNNFFQFIYRAATGVSWDAKSNSFISQPPKDWSYFDWYKNIVSSVASEMGINLKITPETRWQNVPEELQKEITANF